MTEGLLLLETLPREHREAVMGELASSQLAETLRNIFGGRAIEDLDGVSYERGTPVQDDGGGASAAGSAVLPGTAQSERSEDGEAGPPNHHDDKVDSDQWGGTQRTAFSTDEADEHLMRTVENEAAAPAGPRRPLSLELSNTKSMSLKYGPTSVHHLLLLYYSPC